MRAYIERVTSVNPMLNAVVQDRFELALQEAKAMDLLLDSANGLVEGKPLLGVPMTVKESVAVKGDAASLCVCELLDGFYIVRSGESVSLSKAETHLQSFILLLQIASWVSERTWNVA